ncbi:tRNA (adenosine(37)-N6)-threonylcarbamoyltransferase complex transferase subunit TsaD, partial [Patescibacteria group bacterium]|nr:tRNA (adenosine(37)-N6)-threonylcarbamoyltransferase complex transferase subunit TsaD [Patescibacteria group bacterium]
EVAARAHIENILPVIKKSLKKIDYKKIDLISVTQGPGLITSLLVGLETAKTLSYAWKKPLMGVNHLNGHLAVNFIEHEIKNVFPAISLIVSGGHTELGLMKKSGSYKKIGQTRDDAAGECFDKIAKLLKIGYPGGPAVAHYATQSSIINHQSSINFPRPMIKTNDFDFSFSGLKTAVLYFVKKNKNKLEKKKFVQNICAESQQAIIDVLIHKTIKASKKYKAKSVFLSGGVAANQELREQLKLHICKLPNNVKFFVPSRNLCTDNAVMIAAAAALKFKNLTPIQKKKLKNNWQKIKVDPNLSL